MSDMQVYVMTNESFDGWVKVGESLDPATRVTQFQIGAPTDYVLQHSEFLFSDRPVHKYLVEQGIERRLEWFKCSTQTAVDAINTVKAELSDEALESIKLRQDYESRFTDQCEVVFT